MTIQEKALELFPHDSDNVTDDINAIKRKIFIDGYNYRDEDESEGCEFRQRMYHLTMYNISPIQQGIQSYHAGIEYVLKHSNTPEFKQWANNDKVVIILNGGTSNNIGYDVWQNECAGTMEQQMAALSGAGIDNAPFYEPDLNNSLSAIAFLVDERVWDRENYPDPSQEHLCDKNGYFPQTMELIQERTFEYFKNLYGDKVAFLRMWLKQFKFA